MALSGSFRYDAITLYDKILIFSYKKCVNHIK
jgi:hypothetical protein